MLERLHNLSLRIRLSIAFAIAILPFAALFLYADLRYYRPLANQFSLLASEVEAHFAAVTRLQLALSRSAMPPNDYLIHGGEEERQRFMIATKEVDDAFAALANSIRNAHPFEADKLSSLRQRWAIASNLGTTLLNWPVNDRHSQAAVETMQFFDAEIDHLADESDLLLAHVRSDLRNAWHKAVSRHEDLAHTVGLAAMLAAALTLAMVVYVSRSILKPLKLLEAGALRFSSGGLDHRIGLRRTDEFGKLASTMDEMANQLGSRQRDLLDAAAHDALTGLWNRRFFDRQLDIEIEHALNEATSLSLLMLDLDNFKLVNDSHGHQAGDVILKTVADRLRHVIRHADYPVRYGGDEFAVLMPGTSAEEAAVIAERVRVHISELPIRVPQATLTVTVSIGVAGDLPNQPHRSYGPSLLTRADQALYSAKHRGSNRVERFE